MENWDKRAGRWGEIRVSPLMALGVILLLVAIGCICVVVEQAVKGTATSLFIRTNALIVAICLGGAAISVLFTRKHWVIPGRDEPIARSSATAALLGCSIALGGLLIIFATLASGARGVHWGIFALVGGIGMAISGRWMRFS